MVNQPAKPPGLPLDESAKITKNTTIPWSLMIPRILLTAGEPAGIGPELCVQIAQSPLDCALTVVADPGLLVDRAARLGLPLELLPEDANAQHRPGSLRLWPVESAAGAVCGRPNPAHAGYVLDTIAQAVHACLEGRYHALVTAPVHKGVINDAGIPFTGHTEFIAGITGGEPVMLLTAPGLRVALATTHLPLIEVSRALTRDRLERVIRILQRDLRERYGLSEPRILVCGLNPHAGEGGHLGREELDTIGPALEALRAEGICLTGPLSADTLFQPRHLERADVVLAMYHDQGLPVLKYMGFGRAVNVTLGLPILRTSVDHGTALELAGTGQADAGSLEAAIDTAIGLARSHLFRRTAA